jgi:signal transduction histidine kinase
VFIGGTAAAVMIATIVLLVLHARSRELEFEKNRDIDLAKDDLLSIASHQLRTPATGVKQYLGLVLQGFAGDVSEQQRDLLQRAYKSNDRQLDVINEILHLAKIESGRIILSKREFDMSEMIRDVAGDLAQDIDEQQHKFVLKLPKRAVMYNGDSHMIHISVENLLSNAIKYTPAGGTITVGLRSNQEYIDIYVKDSGIGIDQEDREKLFVAFGRIVNERSRMVSGTGVGLYLVKHLIEMHGGEILLESEVDRGSTFTIRLPRDVRFITEERKDAPVL